LYFHKSYLYIIFISVAVTLVLVVFPAFLTNFGLNASWQDFLFLKADLGSPNLSLENTYLIHHEWWRLITPVFLHFSITHLAFNCLWIYILGSRIEGLDGKAIFLLIFLISGIASNAGEFIWTGQYFFGGLSGSVYGLLGYCFIMDLDQKMSRYDLPIALYLFMFIWLLIGFTGILSFFGFGNIANTAHLVGMMAGFILGLIAKYGFKI
tara:strand:+ start:65 stop:691 length:627 start_codon:yes stop_codon:yes gene_type:complete